MISDQISIGEASVETFSPFVGGSFGVHADEGSPEVTRFVLSSATAARHKNPGFRDPFSLMFTGSADLALNQGTYYLSHPSLGVFPLFIVPIAGNSETREYQAIFN